MIKRVLFLSVCLINPLYASAGAELNHFFNNIGFASNVTGSHSYESQAAGFASLGSVYARNQVRNIQLMHVDVPSMTAGCGGIDLTAGGFSFITGDQIVKFMQSILSNGAGYAMNLALETELPEIAHAMQYMQKLASDINNNNLSSCELAENASAMLWPKNRAAHQQICQDIGQHTGHFSDWAKARQKCSTGKEIDEGLAAAKANPEYKDRVLVNTNVVWEALQKQSFLRTDASLAEVYLSISGTLVFDAKGGMKTYPSLARNADFIKALLYGGELPSYHCRDGGKGGACLDIDGNAHQTIAAKDALVTQVQTLLQEIYQHIKTNTALTPQQNGLIELTQPPVFKLISASAQQNIGVQSSYELAQTVATDLLAQYLSNSLDVINGAIAGKDLGKDAEAVLFKNLQVAQEVVANFSGESRARFNTALKTNQLAQENVKQGLNALNPMLRQAYVEGAL